jgi:hypothetical protein
MGLAIVDRVGTGEVAEAYMEPGLRGGGGGMEMEVSGAVVCDTVLERPREKSPGREGREEVVGELTVAVACGCALEIISEIFSRKIG